jgi:hypothetical protein
VLNAKKTSILISHIKTFQGQKEMAAARDTIISLVIGRAPYIHTVWLLISLARELRESDDFPDSLLMVPNVM